MKTLILILLTYYTAATEHHQQSPFASLRKDKTPQLSSKITDPAFIPYKAMAGTLAYAHAAITININDIIQETKAICICNNQKDLFKEYSVQKMHFKILEKECNYAETFVDTQLAFIFE